MYILLILVISIVLGTVEHIKYSFELKNESYKVERHSD